MAAFGTGLFQWGDKRYYSCQRLHLLRLDWDLEPVMSARFVNGQAEQISGIQAVLACTQFQYGCSTSNALTCINQRCIPKMQAWLDVQYTGMNRFVALTVAAEHVTCRVSKSMSWPEMAGKLRLLNTKPRACLVSAWSEFTKLTCIVCSSLAGSAAPYRTPAVGMKEVEVHFVPEQYCVVLNPGMLLPLNIGVSPADRGRQQLPAFGSCPGVVLLKGDIVLI